MASRHNGAAHGGLSRTPSQRAIVPKAGDPLSARILGDAAKKLNQIHFGTLVPYSNGAPAQFLVSVLARVEEVKGDYLVCVQAQIDDEGEVETVGEKFNAYKPYLLQRTPFEDLTRGDFSYTYQSDTERTSDDDGDEEEQIIVPEYLVEEDLIILHHVAIGMGAAQDEDGVPIIWIDSNNDGRMWGKKA